MGAATPLRVAILADTPRRLPSTLLGELAGVSRILHAGGHRDPALLQELRRLAPVDAVSGHRDFAELGLDLPETREIELAGAQLFLTHMAGTAPQYVRALRDRMQAMPPDAVIYGHAPEPRVEWVGGTLFVNPGSARGSGRRATWALLEIEGAGRLTGHLMPLP